MAKVAEVAPVIEYSDRPTAGAINLSTTEAELSQQTTIKEVGDDISLSLHAQERSRIRAIMIVVACAGTQILNVCAAAGVNMAIPVMARDLRMGSDKIPWIASAFALTSGCLLLLFGRLADLYGRKLVWQLGALWTVAITFGCAFSQTGIQIIVLRAMAGAGPAAMVPAALGILAHSFPPSRARSTAFATFSAGAPLGGALGIVFGGVLTQYTTWRGLFYFVIALGAVVFVVGYFAIENDPPAPNQDKRIDWIGAFLVTSGLVLITFSLSDASSIGWSSPVIISLLIIGFILVSSFIAWEYHLTHRTSFPPLMPLDIWARDHGRFAAMQVVGFLEWACFTNLSMYAMLYYQNYLSLSPLLTMYRFLPMPVTGLICNVIVAIVVNHISGAYLLALGLAATSTSAALFAAIDPVAPYWVYGFPAAITCVLGADFAFACGTLFIAKIARPSEQSVAGAIFQTIVALGTSVGLSITNVAQIGGMKSEAERLGLSVNVDAPVTEIPPAVLLKGYRLAQWTGFAFGACGLLIVVIFLNGIGIVGSKRRIRAMPPLEVESARNEKSGKKMPPT